MSPAEGLSGQEMITLTLNGTEVRALPGQTILEVARAEGVDIPTLCYDPRLEAYGACRMCLVEVDGARGPMAACGTKVSQGMKVQTHSEKIFKLRKFVLELLLTNHPLDCPVCEAAGDCRLQDYAYEYLVDMVPWGWRPPVVGEPGEHPNVAHFGARCILCGRCVRICREVMSIGCWGYLNRGYDSEVDTPYRLPLAEVGCVSCGQCVSTCPVGAVVGQRSPQGARAWQTTRTVTTCSYCADGCRLVAHSFRDRVVRVSADEERGLNRGNLCVRGRFSHGYIEAPDRLLTPQVSQPGDGATEARWDQALRVAAEKIAAVRNTHGGQAVAAICGTNCTNETAYLVQKLMRTVVGSNNVDSIDHPDLLASEKACTLALGVDSPTNSRLDLTEAQAILVLGANLTECDPVLALTVIEALRRGRPVIVVDPRTTELASRAAYHLAVKPGTDLAVLRAMMKHIVDLKLEDRAFIDEKTEGFAALEASLAGVDIAAEAAVAGVDPELVRAAAVAFAQAASAAVFVGAGLSQGPQPEETVSAAASLALLTGNVGRAGTGLYPVRGGANSQGLIDMGVRPTRFPGGSGANDAGALARLSAAWGADLAGLAPGVSTADLIAAIEAGTVKAVYAVGADLALALPDEERVRKALDGLDVLVVQDSFPTDTSAHADVVLAAAVAFEDEGTFTNGERFVQRVRAAISTRGQSEMDWAIVQKLANALGADWVYATPADVMREIAEVVPAYQGVTYPALEESGIQVSTATAEEGGAPVLPIGGFPSYKGRFAPLAQVSAASAGRPDFPLTLVTGSVKEHHGTGVRTRRSPGSSRLVPEVRLEVNPKDATSAGVSNGDKVRVTAEEGGTVEVEAAVTTRVPAGVVFLPGFSAAAPVSRLLKSGGQPNVRVEKA
jgi:predicted molibdopterin-dependent oxidoreductase YjgC